MAYAVLIHIIPGQVDFFAGPLCVPLKVQQNVRAACPREMLEFKFFFKPCTQYIAFKVIPWFCTAHLLLRLTIIVRIELSRVVKRVSNLVLL